MRENIDAVFRTVFHLTDKQLQAHSHALCNVHYVLLGDTAGGVMRGRAPRRHVDPSPTVPTPQLAVQPRAHPHPTHAPHP